MSFKKNTRALLIVQRLRVRGRGRLRRRAPLELLALRLLGLALRLLVLRQDAVDGLGNLDVAREAKALEGAREVRVRAHGRDDVLVGHALRLARGRLLVGLLEHVGNDVLHHARQEDAGRAEDLLGNPRVAQLLVDARDGKGEPRARRLGHGRLLDRRVRHGCPFIMPRPASRRAR